MSGFLSGIWLKLCIAGAFVGLVLLAVLKLIGMGRDQERYKAATEALRRTQDANAARVEASKPVSKEAENADPYNRDR